MKETDKIHLLCDGFLIYVYKNHHFIRMILKPMKLSVRQMEVHLKP